MDDGGSPSMKKVESLEDLSTPAPQYFNFHHLEPLQISTGEEIKIFTYSHIANKVNVVFSWHLTREHIIGF